jgi:hypothetical protein
VLPKKRKKEKEKEVTGVLKSMENQAMQRKAESCPDLQPWLLVGGRGKMT